MESRLSAPDGPGVFPVEPVVTTPDQALTNDFLRLVREFAHANALDPFGVLALTASSLCLMSVAWASTGTVPPEERDVVGALIEHYLPQYERMIQAGGGPTH